MESDFLENLFENLFELNFVFGILMFVIWLGYVMFAIAIVGRTRVLARTLQTSLSAINIFVSWVHLVIVLIAGIVALLLIIL
jgi:hypothetical protein